jgi:hypothetical protein
MMPLAYALWVIFWYSNLNSIEEWFYMRGDVFPPSPISRALAQPLPDATKLAPVYQQQRNAEADGRAQCYAIVVDLQAKIAQLEKELAEKPKEEPK